MRPFCNRRLDYGGDQPAPAGTTGSLRSARDDVLGLFGRWSFEEFGEVYDMDKELKALIDKVVGEHGEDVIRSEAKQSSIGP